MSRQEVSSFISLQRERFQKKFLEPNPDEDRHAYYKRLVRTYKKLTPTQQRLWQTIIVYVVFCKRVCPAQLTLANRLGVTRETVNRCLGRLEREGFVVAVYRHRHPSRYGLLPWIQDLGVRHYLVDNIPDFLDIKALGFDYKKSFAGHPTHSVNSSNVTPLNTLLLRNTKSLVRESYCGGSTLHTDIKRELKKQDYFYDATTEGCVCMYEGFSETKKNLLNELGPNRALLVELEKFSVDAVQYALMQFKQKADEGVVFQDTESTFLRFCNEFAVTYHEHIDWKRTKRLKEKEGDLGKPSFCNARMLMPVTKKVIKKACKNDVTQLARKTAQTLGGAIKGTSMSTNTPGERHGSSEYTYEPRERSQKRYSATFRQHMNVNDMPDYEQREIRKMHEDRRDERVELTRQTIMQRDARVEMYDPEEERKKAVEKARSGQAQVSGKAADFMNILAGNNG